jgi:hypothetical protein
MAQHPTHGRQKSHRLSPRRAGRGTPTVALVTMVTGAVMALAGCGAGEPAGAAVVRDSAGIRIVENAAPAWAAGEAWRLSATPEVEIGVLDGEPAYQFHGLHEILRLDDGRIVVLDGGSSEIRSFDAEGRHLWTAGGRGEGPGEFRTPGALVRFRADSLAVWDGSAWRGTVYTADGEFARTYTLTGDEERFDRPYTRGVFADGSVFAQAALPSHRRLAERSGPRWYEDVLVRIPMDGEPVVLGEFPSIQCDPRPGRECRPLGHGSRGMSHAHGSRLYYGRSDRNEIRVHDGDGVLTAIIRGPGEPEPVTDAMIGRYKEAVLAGYPDRQQQIRAQLEEGSHASTLPAFSRFLVDAAGYIWVEEYRPESAIRMWPQAIAEPRTEPVRWSVYDPEGVFLGAVTVPADFVIREIGDDWLLGVARDDLDVEWVRLYRLEKPTG